MASCSLDSSSIIVFLVGFLMVSFHVPSSLASPPENSTNYFRPSDEIRFLLQKFNKPSLKSIQSPDGDVIDCVHEHLQPAFDHPKLKGQKILGSPERPKRYVPSGHGEIAGIFQKWHLTGESCPQGSVPIRRTGEEDISRADDVKSFGRKPATTFRRDSATAGGHEHAVGYVAGDQLYGAQAKLNVWSPKVGGPSEFSLSQIWVLSGSFGEDLNTIEAGWQVSPQLYGDKRPRFFTYWTSDAYQETGCYNLLCSGFVQTNNRVAIGAAIHPTSARGGPQFDIEILIWKDPKHGSWWLELGSGELVGYWPSFLFTRLADHATMIQFGGEIFNSKAFYRQEVAGDGGAHTSTQMGSGGFAETGFRHAAYFRNLQMVDWDNSLLPLPSASFRLLADRPDCYDIRGGVGSDWGDYFYYGGPGRNPRCP